MWFVPPQSPRRREVFGVGDVVFKNRRLRRYNGLK
ncbi:MAG: hypothetical protein RL757_707 [Bacteroidota bacterium]|jgi:hypothetical protein